MLIWIYKWLIYNILTLLTFELVPVAGAREVYALGKKPDEISCDAKSTLARSMLCNTCTDNWFFEQKSLCARFLTDSWALPPEPRLREPERTALATALSPLFENSSNTLWSVNKSECPCLKRCLARRTCSRDPVVKNGVFSPILAAMLKIGSIHLNKHPYTNIFPTWTSTGIWPRCAPSGVSLAAASSLLLTAHSNPFSGNPVGVRDVSSIATRVCAYPPLVWPAFVLTLVLGDCYFG